MYIAPVEFLEGKLICSICKEPLLNEMLKHTNHVDPAEVDASFREDPLRREESYVYMSTWNVRQRVLQELSKNNGNN